MASKSAQTSLGAVAAPGQFPSVSRGILKGEPGGKPPKKTSYILIAGRVLRAKTTSRGLEAWIPFYLRPIPVLMGRSEPRMSSQEQTELCPRMSSQSSVLSASHGTRSGHQEQPPKLVGDRNGSPSPHCPHSPAQSHHSSLFRKKETIQSFVWPCCCQPSVHPQLLCCAEGRGLPQALPAGILLLHGICSRPSILNPGKIGPFAVFTECVFYRMPCLKAINQANIAFYNQITSQKMTEMFSYLHCLECTRVRGDSSGWRGAGDGRVLLE